MYCGRQATRLEIITALGSFPEGFGFEIIQSTFAQSDLPAVPGVFAKTTKTFAPYESLSSLTCGIMRDGRREASGALQRVTALFDDSARCVNAHDRDEMGREYLPTEFARADFSLIRVAIDGRRHEYVLIPSFEMFRYRYSQHSPVMAWFRTLTEEVPEGINSTDAEEIRSVRARLHNQWTAHRLATDCGAHYRLGPSAIYGLFSRLNDDCVFVHSILALMPHTSPELILLNLHIEDWRTNISSPAYRPSAAQLQSCNPEARVPTVHTEFRGEVDRPTNQMHLPLTVMQVASTASLIELYRESGFRHLSPDKSLVARFSADPTHLPPVRLAATNAGMIFIDGYEQLSVAARLGLLEVPSLLQFMSLPDARRYAYEAALTRC